MLDKETIFSISGHATHDPLDILTSIGVDIEPPGCEESRIVHISFSVDDSGYFEYIPHTKEFSAAISFPAEFEENTKFTLWELLTEDNTPKRFKICIDKFDVYENFNQSSYPSKIKWYSNHNKQISHKCLVLKKSK